MTRGGARPEPKRPRGRPRKADADKVTFRTISVRLESGLVDAFHARCAEKNVNAQQQLREWIEKILSE